jgi:hypothetical protein
MRASSILRCPRARPRPHTSEASHRKRIGGMPPATCAPAASSGRPATGARFRRTSTLACHPGVIKETRTKQASHQAGEVLVSLRRRLRQNPGQTSTPVYTLHPLTALFTTMFAYSLALLPGIPGPGGVLFWLKKVETKQNPRPCAPAAASPDWNSL